MVSLKVYYYSWNRISFKIQAKILNFKLKLLILFLVSAFSPLSSWLSECLWAVLIVLTGANEIPSVVSKLKFRPSLYLMIFRDLLIGSW